MVTLTSGWTLPNVIIWANNIADALSAADPDNADGYRANADAYIEEINTLITEIDAMVESVPAEDRVIVTNHDFMDTSLMLMNLKL